MKLSMKAARVNAGMTQAELADKMGVSTGTIYLWENDKISPKVCQLQRFCEVTGTTISDIFLSSDLS